MKKYDVAVIGGGVTGTLTLRELTAKGFKCVLFEAGSDLASGATRANSAIIHAGFDPKPGSLKGKMNVRGAELYPELAKALDFPFLPMPSLVTAFAPEEEATVEELLNRGIGHGVKGLKTITKAQLLDLEPNISDIARCALFAPSAIVEPWSVAIAAAENAADNGAEVLRSAPVTAIDPTGDGYVITAVRKGEKIKVAANAVVNAAGIHAADVHGLLTPPSYKMIPKRGQYFILDRGAKGLVNNVLFPCPSEKGKGMLIFPEIHGRIMIGPDSEPISDPDGIETEASSINAIRDAVKKYLRVPIPYGLTIRTFAGVRPAADRGDFIIEEVENFKSFFDAAGIESPGLASAPAVARELCRLVCNRLGSGGSCESFNPCRRPRLTTALAAEKGVAGSSTIVCRCEKVSEAEIVDCIRRNCGAVTVKGVKMRTSSGAGGCQGGYCQPEIVKILSRELGIPPEEVLYDEEGSNILIGKIRGTGK